MNTVAEVKELRRNSFSTALSSIDYQFKCCHRKQELFTTTVTTTFSLFFSFHFCQSQK